MLIPSTSPFGHFHVNNVGPFRQTISSRSNSSAYSLFGASTPSGSSTDGSAFTENRLSPFGNTSRFPVTTETGSIAFASTSCVGNQCGGSAVASYSETPEVDGINSMLFARKIKSISAMSVYENKSHEELRSEDYEPRKGKTGGIPYTSGIGNQCQGSAVASYSETPEVDGINSMLFAGKIKSISAMSVYENKSHEELRSEDYEPRKGKTGGIPYTSGIGNQCQGSAVASYSETPEVDGINSMLFAGKIKSISAMSVYENKSHEELRSEDYEPRKGKTGGIAYTSGIGNQCQGSAVASYSASPEVYGINSRFSAENMQSISAMIVYRNKSHEELRSEDYELRKGITFPTQNQASAFQKLNSLDGLCTVSVPSSQSSFDCLSRLAYGTTTAAALMSDSSIKPPFCSTSTPFGVYPSSFFGGSIGNGNVDQYQINSATGASNSKSIGAPNKDRSHEEWRLEDYELRNRGGQTVWGGEFLGSSSFKTSDTSRNIFCSALLSNHSSVNSPLQTIKSYLSVPKTENFTNPNNTISTSPTNSPSMSPFFSDLFSSHSQAFISQPTAVSFVPTFTPNLNPSSLIPLSKSMLPSRSQCPRISTAVTIPSVVTFSMSRPSVTVSPSKQSTSVLDPSPSILNASQPGQTAEIVDTFSTDDLSQPSQGKGHSDNENSPGLTDETFIQEEDLSAILNSHQNDVAAVTEKHKADVLALMPKLPDGEYYMEPSLKVLAAKEMAEPGFCSRVSDFVVGRWGYGSIKFLGETDVRHLDLESIVQFNIREVIIYADDRKKPAAGHCLNKPAEVTLLNVKCICKKTGKQFVEGLQVHSYREKLIKKSSEIGAEFVSYDPVQGEWKFRVQLF